MKKCKVRFFLDYGLCFWGLTDDGESQGGISNEDLPLCEDTLQQLELFMAEYNAFYSLGLPPYEEHNLEYCQIFNRELKRISDLVFPELADEFIICHEQPELTEDAGILNELWNNYLSVKERQKRFYNIDDETYL